MGLIPPRLRQKTAIARSHLRRLAASPERRRRRRWAIDIRSADPELFIPNPDVVRETERLDREGFSPCILPEEVRNELLDSWRALLSEHDTVSEIARTTGKAFMQERLSDNALKTYRGFVNASIEQNVLAAVTGAMGMIPHLESIDVIESNPSGRELSASQLWHYDINDQRIIKLFVYLEDCGPENGPFTFVPADSSQRVARNVGHYVDDDRLSKAVPESTWEKVEGTSGTAFLIDTGRCYHFGSRCQKPRVAMIATYSSGLKFMKRANTWGSIMDVSSLSELQRAVCDLK